MTLKKFLPIFLYGALALGLVFLPGIPNLSHPPLQKQDGDIPLLYYYTPDCIDCETIRIELFERIQAEQEVSLNVTYIDVEEGDEFSKFLELEKRSGRSSPGFPVVFVGTQFFAGEEDIFAYLPEAVDRTLRADEDIQNYFPFLANEIETGPDRKDLLSDLKMLLVFHAGLIDGINPCAFSTLIFLLSFLFFMKFRKKRVLTIGVFYTIGVFLTYFLVGLGAFSFLQKLSVYRIVGTLIDRMSMALVAFFLLLSIHDVFVYIITKKSDFLLQLPRGMKKRIHERIHEHMSAGRFIISAFSLGFLISLFEMACTGQIYLPTIMVILQDPDLKAKGVLWLLLYNLAFILPLIAVFVITWFGVSSKALEKTFKRNLLLVKILLVILFAGFFIFFWLY